MSCRYYLFPINNIYASVLYACYLFSRQIIYLFFLLLLNDYSEMAVETIKKYATIEIRQEQ